MLVYINHLDGASTNECTSELVGVRVTQISQRTMSSFVIKGSIFKDCDQIVLVVSIYLGDYRDV